MEDEMILHIDPRLAKKYLEANVYEDRKCGKALQVLDEIEKKYEVNYGNPNPWKVWVYLKFEYPNKVLGFITHLYKRFPRLAESLVSSANAEFLLGVYIFVVMEDGPRVVITNFLRI
jgi:hypothetical protein